MRFHPMRLPGVVRIELERFEDARGYFARTWCDREAAAVGLRVPMVQSSVAFNRLKGTLRGLHYHADGFDQARAVRCVAGAAFVALLDLRSELETFLQTIDVTLDVDGQSGLYVPAGVAIGYQTLVDHTMIAYQMPEFYDPALERGVRWNDPAFGILWPDNRPTLSERDATYPGFDPVAHRAARARAGRG